MLWLRPPRRLRPTRDGLWFLLATLGVGFAAVNTGNNLLFFVMGLLLAAIVISGVLSESNLRGLRLRRELPRGVFAGEPSSARLVVDNTKPRSPSMGLVFRELAAKGETAYVAHAPAGGRGSGTYTLHSDVRGPLELGPIEVSTTWPFGLFKKSRTLEIEDVMLVWPRRVEAPAIDDASRVDRGQRPRTQRGEGYDLFGLRDYVPGEDARQIHWKATARAGVPIVRETSAEDARSTLLFVEADGDEEFERAVEQAAAAAEKLLAAGHHVGLCAGTQVVAPMAGGRARVELLDALALAQPDPNALPQKIPGVRVLRVRAAGVAR